MEFLKLGEIRDFSGFFVHLCGDAGFWAKNGGWCVNLRGMGEIDKKNASKNVEKMAKIGKNFNKFGKIQLFWQKFIKIHTSFKLTFC